jgi:hypothetical protein
MAVPALRTAETSSDADARALAIGRAFLRYQEQLRAVPAAGETDAQWWRTAPVTTIDPVAREKVAAAEREFNDAVRASLGSDPVPATGRDPRYSFLPESKQAAVAAIEQRFNDRSADLRREMGTLRLPADLDRLRELGAAHERELSAALTPAEREQFELRVSRTADAVRRNYGELIASEGEYRKIFALQKAFDEKYAGDEIAYAARPADTLRLRSEAERKLLEDIGAIVGPDRAALFRRASDQDFTLLKTLGRRLNLPLRTTDTVMDLRESYAQQSMAINGEAGMDMMRRRAAIIELAGEARRELTDALGKDAMEIYAPRSNWLRYLEQGTAYSTNPKDSMSTYTSLSSGVYMVSPSGGSTSSVVTQGPGGTTVITRGTSTAGTSPPTAAKKSAPAPADSPPAAGKK